MSKFMSIETGIINAKRKEVSEYFRNREYVNCVRSSEDIELIRKPTVETSMYRAISLVELGRVDEGTETLRQLSKDQPDIALNLASYHYLNKRTRTSEGYGFENGWITMLDVVVESGICGKSKATRRNSSFQTCSCNIPSRIIQYWDQNNPPTEVANLMRRTREENESLSQSIFSDEKAKEYISSKMGSHVGHLYSSAPHVAAKADLFRLVYLYEEGGVYIDADEFCLRPVSEMFTKDNCTLIISYSRSTPSCINNWFVGVMPKHPLLELTLRYAIANLESQSHSTGNKNVWLLTGPGVWTIAFIDWIINPLTPLSDKQDVLLIEEGEYRQFFSSPQLEYKSSAHGNWRL